MRIYSANFSTLQKSRHCVRPCRCTLSTCFPFFLLFSWHHNTSKKDMLVEKLSNILLRIIEIYRSGVLFVSEISKSTTTTPKSVSQRKDVVVEGKTVYWDWFSLQRWRWGGIQEWDFIRVLFRTKYIFKVMSTPKEQGCPSTRSSKRSIRPRTFPQSWHHWPDASNALSYVIWLSIKLFCCGFCRVLRCLH